LTKPGFNQRTVTRASATEAGPSDRQGAFKNLEDVRTLLEGPDIVPRRIVHPKPDEPAEQKIELHSFHQMPLRANPIKCLQQHRPKQLLRCD
jgi:hypothetical protein